VKKPGSGASNPFDSKSEQLTQFLMTVSFGKTPGRAPLSPLPANLQAGNANFAMNLNSCYPSHPNNPAIRGDPIDRSGSPPAKKTTAD